MRGEARAPGARGAGEGPRPSSPATPPGRGLPGWAQDGAPSPAVVWTPGVSGAAKPGVRALLPPPKPGVTACDLSLYPVPSVQSQGDVGPPQTAVRIQGRQFPALGNW